MYYCDILCILKRGDLVESTWSVILINKRGIDIDVASLSIRVNIRDIKRGVGMECVCVRVGACEGKGGGEPNKRQVRSEMPQTRPPEDHSHCAGD